MTIISSKFVGNNSLIGPLKNTKRGVYNKEDNSVFGIWYSNLEPWFYNGSLSEK